MSDRAVAQLFRSRFELGADASAAAGPVGRDTQASTDEKLTAEIRRRPSRSTAPRPGVQAILAGQVVAPREASSFVDEMGAAFPSRDADGTAVNAPQPRWIAFAGRGDPSSYAGNLRPNPVRITTTS